MRVRSVRRLGSGGRLSGFVSRSDPSYMAGTIRLTSYSGVPPSDVWPGVCAVDAAVYGQEAWSVCKPAMERLLHDRGFALSVAWAGSAVVGFSSAVCVTAECAREVLAAGYEERDVGPQDVLACGPHAYWYGTSTCVLPDWRQQGIGTRLLAERLHAIAAVSAQLPEVHVIAQMWSDGGRATFSRFGAVAVGPASMELACAPGDLAQRAQIHM